MLARMSKAKKKATGARATSPKKEAVKGPDLSSYPLALRWLSERHDIERLRAVRANDNAFRLDRMQALMAALGNPQNQVKAVHVAGTVGKGSTCAMIAAMLEACGYTVGVYTSPHLVDVRERIAINGASISKHDFTEGMQRVANAAATAGVDPTFFEVLTALGLCYFADEAVDVAIVEVGLGGRLDSTNIITPLVSVVTAIDFDHTRILGTTLPQIAKEKAGIFKKGVPALFFAQAPEVDKVFVDYAAACGASLRIVNRDIEFSSRFCSNPDLGAHTRVCLYSKSTRLEHLPVPLPGEHQASNCALALAAVDVLQQAGFQCPEDRLTAGLARSRVPGRMELISQRPRILVDGAHNPASMNALMRCVGAYVPYDSMVCIFGCCQDKDMAAMLDRVNLGADKVVFTRALSNPRAADPHELQRLFQERSGKMSQVARSLPEAMEIAMRAVSRDDLICVTGSFYLVGEAMKFVSERNPTAEPTATAGASR